MDETRIEIVPSDEGFVVAISGKSWTSCVRGFSDQIDAVARDLLEANCSWMPKEIVDFAQDVTARRKHSIDLSQWLSEQPQVDIANDDREQTERALQALRELRALFSDMFAATRKQEEMAAKCAERGDTGLIQ